MQCSSYCMRCMIDKQHDRISRYKDEEKKRRFMKIMLSEIGSCERTDTTPYLSYRFDRLYEEIFDDKIEFGKVKDEYNQLILDNEADFKRRIAESEDPLRTSLVFARTGNYIDFGAMIDVNKDKLMELFDSEEAGNIDRDVYGNFIDDCDRAKNFLLLTDNCGEVVLDRFFVEELKKKFPRLKIRVMVKGGDVMNDATCMDARQAGMYDVAEVVDTGNDIAGSDPERLSDEALEIFNNADVILAKGQANFETVFGTGRNSYFSFLCKCRYFSDTFNVPQFTGMLVRERDGNPFV